MVVHQYAGVFGRGSHEIQNRREMTHIRRGGALRDLQTLVSLAEYRSVGINLEVRPGGLCECTSTSFALLQEYRSIVQLDSLVKMDCELIAKYSSVSSTSIVSPFGFVKDRALAHWIIERVRWRQIGPDVWLITRNPWLMLQQASEQMLNSMANDNDLRRQLEVNEILWQR